MSREKRRPIVVVKTGTAVITQADGTLDYNQLERLCRGVSAIHEAGCAPVLVTSGAVASGRGIRLRSNDTEEEPPRLGRNTLAALGQCRLMFHYLQMLETQRSPLHVGQVLLTRYDFSSTERYGAIREMIFEMIDNDILPIVNHNDVIRLGSLEFTDNDHLAAFLSVMLQASRLILLTDVEGLFTSNPKLDPAAERIGVLVAGDKWPHFQLDERNSSAGGMASKIAAIKTMAAVGISAAIVNGRAKDALERTVLEMDEAVGTFLLIPPDQQTSAMENFRRWLAAGATPVGTVIVSALGVDAIFERRGSVLAAGVEEVWGQFAADDIVAIRDNDDLRLLGVGRAKVGSDTLREMGRVADRIIIHADYLVAAREAPLFSDERGAVASLAKLMRSRGFEVQRYRSFKEKKFRLLLNRQEVPVDAAVATRLRRAAPCADSLGVRFEDLAHYALASAFRPAELRSRETGVKVDQAGA